ncbi:MAG: hypothetical protein ABFD91_04045 [Anaerohalosphaeraceae bacterium]
MKLLIVTGSHPDVLDDIKAIGNAAAHADYMAIGLDAVDKYLWDIEFMATYHPVDISPAAERRRKKGGNLDYTVISHERKSGVGMIIPYEEPSGGSAFLGAYAGVLMKYDKIIVCGCPLIGRNAKGENYAQFRKGWEHHKEKLRGQVRSVSGWTAEFLGKPTEEWIYAID